MTKDERYQVEWRTFTFIDGDGDHDPDLDGYSRRHFANIKAAIAFAKKCPCDQGPVHICRQLMRDEICGDENFGPRWEYDGEGVLVAVEGQEVTDYRRQTQ